MDGHQFDRLARLLTTPSGRRSALLSLLAPALSAAGLGLALDDAAAKKRRKRRCRKRRQACGGRKKCCGKDTACREFPSAECTTLTGKRCCGLEGAACSNDPAINHCDCCPGLFCSGVEGTGRCQEEPT